MNTLPDRDGRFQSLAQGIVAAIPGLGGYFGVDLILTGDGPSVVDVNPRLTTSYAGLRAGLGHQRREHGALDVERRRGGATTRRRAGRPCACVSLAHERSAAAGG